MNTPTVEDLEQIKKTRIITEMRILAEKLKAQGKIEFNKDNRKYK